MNGRTPLPPLPQHLVQRLDLPWDPAPSRQVDRWLAYVAAEFELPDRHHNRRISPDSLEGGES